jgi:hypothetical protein
MSAALLSARLANCSTAPAKALRAMLLDEAKARRPKTRAHTWWPGAA